MNLKEITINNIVWKLIDFPQEPIRPTEPKKLASSIVNRGYNDIAKILEDCCSFTIKVVDFLFSLTFPITGIALIVRGYSLLNINNSRESPIGLILLGSGFILSYIICVIISLKEKMLPSVPILNILIYMVLYLLFFILTGIIYCMYRVLTFPFMLFSKERDVLKQYKIENEKYKSELKEYENQLNILTRLFPGIDNHSFSFASYTTTIINEMLKFLQESVKDTEKRKIKDWWLSLSGTSFEFEVERWFQSQGYKTQHTGETGDGGVDIILQDENKEQIYVQCKHYTKSKVGVETVRNLIGAMTLGNVRKGIIVCLLGITKDAQEAIDKSGIVVYTLADLLPLESYLQSSKKDLQKSLFDTKPVCSTNDLSFQQISPCKVRIGNYQINTSIMHDDRGYSHDIVKTLSSNMYSIFYKGYCFTIEAPLIEIKILENNIRFDRL